MKRILLAVLVAGLATGLPARGRPADRPDLKPTLSLPAAARSQAQTHPAATAKMPAAGAPAKPANEPVPGKTPAVVDSLGLLERVVAKDSTKFDNLTRLGVMYLDRDRPVDAVKVFLKADRVRPKNLQNLVNLGAAYDAGGLPEKAQDAYRRALAISPDDSLATCRLASSLYAKLEYTGAMKLLRDLIAKKPRASCAYFALGVAFADAGIYRDAIRMWKKVVELAPDSPEALSAKESIEVLEKFVGKQ